MSRRRLLKLSAVGLAGVVSGSLLTACQQAPAPAKPAETKPATEAKPAAAAPTAAPAAAAKPAEAAKPAAAAAAATTAPAAGVAAAAAAPKQGGTLIIGSGTPPGPLENSINLGIDTVRYLFEVYDRVVDLDLTSEAPSPPQRPGLAEKWTVSDDALTYTFTLRQGVTFHDGTPMDAEALKWNIERLTKTDHPFYYARGAGITKPIWGRLASATVVNPTTIEMKLTQPYGNFLDTLMQAWAAIASPTAIQKYGNDEAGDHPTGTGPFKQVEHQKGVKLVLEKNASYWGGAPAMDQIIVRPIVESQAAVSALLAGEVHLITNATADSLEVLKARPELAIKYAEPPSTYAWNFKLSEKPFSDKRFRQALNYAVDRETYCKDILRGLGRPAKSFFAPGSIGYDANKPGYTYDPEKAKALLKEAGVADGFSFKMQTYKAQGQDTVALFVKDQLAKVGIKVEVELLEYQTMATNINRDGIAADCGALGWSFSNDRPVSFDRLFTSSFLVPNGPNYTLFNNPQVEELTQKAWKATDQAEKVKLYQQAEAIVTDEAPWLFIYHPIEPRVYSKKMTWSSANSQWYTLRNGGLV